MRYGQILGAMWWHCFFFFSKCYNINVTLGLCTIATDAVISTFGKNQKTFTFGKSRLEICRNRCNQVRVRKRFVKVLICIREIFHGFVKDVAYIC